MGQDQVSGGASVLCWLVAPIEVFYGNLPKFSDKVKIGNKVEFGNKATNFMVQSLINRGDQVPDCHVTFERKILHNL